MKISPSRLLASMLLIATPAMAADPAGLQLAKQHSMSPSVIYPTIKGPVFVIDGRTLWYPQASISVRLAGIDACELPQWAFEAEPSTPAMDSVLRPVPCGPLAKAWLKRAVHGEPVQCNGVSRNADTTLEAHCSVHGNDLSLEMLRVGWARTTKLSSGSYAATQRIAMALRYGMWSTYVLDMNEWRRKAIDRTAMRRPLADMNLLAERESEISPPFADAHRLPKRSDR